MCEENPSLPVQASVCFFLKRNIQSLAFFKAICACISLHLLCPIATKFVHFIFSLVQFAQKKNSSVLWLIVTKVVCYSSPLVFFPVILHVSSLCIYLLFILNQMAVALRAELERNIQASLASDDEDDFLVGVFLDLLQERFGRTKEATWGIQARSSY
jgi:hypothetical protein